MATENALSRHPIAVCLFAASATVVLGCNTPDSVAKFCSAAVATLDAGSPIFLDMKSSCLREVNSRSSLASFAIAKDDDPACEDIGKQATAAKAAGQVLTDYFTALNALASFDSGKAATSASGLADTASGIAKAGTNTKNALEALAKFLATAATSGYQHRQLARDLPQSSQSAIVVLDALSSIVRDDYIGRLLKSEEEKLAIQYRGFASTRQSITPLSVEAQLALYDRWRTDEDAVVAKRASGDKFVIGLQSMSKGLSTLAANADRITAKELIALLAPYVSQLESLVPALQKAL